MKKVCKALAVACLGLVQLGVADELEDAPLQHKGMSMMEEKRAYWASMTRKTGLKSTSGSAAAATCPGGDSGGSVSINGENFPCKNIDFESFISLDDLDISSQGGTTIAADIWGWMSPEGKEITILCLDNGVWFIDVTDPRNPLKLGNMPTGRLKDDWCDVKVYKDVAYIVKDLRENSATRNYGIEVFDLTKLVGLTGSPVRTFSPDFVYAEHGSSHNLAVDTESGFLYSLGTRTCGQGLHMISLEPNPLRPTFAGCVSADGYTHDAQCVVYDGPDTRYTGRQLCFSYNVDALVIWDVTDKSQVQLVSTKGYSTSRYTHQGWLTEDMSYVLLDDELDELRGAVSRTTTYIVDVTDLRNPVFVKTFTHVDVAVDHNLYVWGAIHAKGWGGNPALNNPPSSRFAYLSNYVAGIRVLDIANPLDVSEVGFFDVAPDMTGNLYEGTWSNYMFPSGTLAVSSIDRGLFLLTPRMAFGFPDPTNSPTSGPPVSSPPTGSTEAPTSVPTAECSDRVPSGLHYSDTGEPAPCDEIPEFCDLDIVKEACPATCGLCGCEDKVPSGITYSDGSPAPCSEIGRYCSTYSFVREACPVTCGTCPTARTDDITLKTQTLPSFIPDPKLASVRSTLMNTKLKAWNDRIASGNLPRKNTFSSLNAPAECVNGQAIVNGEVFPCDGIDFLSFMSLEDLFIPGRGGTNSGADIWGWLSPSGKEITIMCVNNGVTFVDSTDPENPIYMAYVLTSRSASLWCDVKVYKSTAYIVKDISGSTNNGIEVIDLLRLEALEPSEYPADLVPDFVYREHGNSHNLVINTESGFLYSVGTGTCSQGLHMIDLVNPLQPVFAGCASQDGYTHDAQCVIYDGPDARYTGRELCFGYNVDALTIWDVTNKQNPIIVSSTPYSGSAYTHQGWLTDDMGFVLLNDELDEAVGIVDHTRTMIFDVRNLHSPSRIGVFDHPEEAIDHNLYVWGTIHRKGWGGNGPLETIPNTRYVYESNYVAGIKVLDLCQVANGELSQVGFFDVAPDVESLDYLGTWSHYLHPSGTLAVSTIDRGLFFLKPKMAYDGKACEDEVPTDAPTVSPPSCEDRVPSGIKFADGKPAECVDIVEYCPVYPVVQERCPKSCGLCNIATKSLCADKSPSGLAYINGVAAPCSEVGVYCTSDSNVAAACPQTCGVCANKKALKSGAIQPLLVTLPVALTDEEEDSENGPRLLSGSTGLVAVGVLGALCLSLLAWVAVLLRRQVKVTSVYSQTNVEEEGGIYKTGPPPSNKTSSEERRTTMSNPMYDA